VTYLAEHHDVNINAVFFRFFRDGEREYLSRVWLREPSAVAAEPGEDTGPGTWNGEYYVSFGGDRSWDEAIKYGFIAGGGGTWYSNTLLLLEPGARVWVNVPGTGYVGVGEVIEGRVPVEEFFVTDDSGHRVPITDLPLKIATGTKASESKDGIPPLFRTLCVGANMSREVANGTSFVHGRVQARSGSSSV
jgi:hypothetical protein